MKQPWSGRVDAERGLVFELHFESANYDAEQQLEAEDGDWNRSGRSSRQARVRRSTPEVTSRGRGARR
ncbi:MAG: hypothetical protein DI536_18355 [Archangium gephyra]|uniref:Uncharacterized protein n=1 Tax=Archangium gephyra TaxID=48 RepID=A0A2W5VL24_9BACT|nr:MAG: hypothetical protein DI536_18355 [Archangium gephyra]